MKTFLHKYGSNVIGVLSGFDRLVFRGTLRYIIYPYGMMAYLRQAGVLLKDFTDYVLKVSTELRQASIGIASKNSMPYIYVLSSRTNKEEIAVDPAQRDGVEHGLICALGCVESCLSFDITSNRQTEKNVVHQAALLVKYAYCASMASSASFRSATAIT